MWGHRRRRSSASVKDYAYSTVSRRLYSIIGQVKTDLSAQLVAGVDGLPLYTHLFGDISPVKVTIETTPELARFAAFTTGPMFEVQHSLRPPAGSGDGDKPYRDLVGVDINRHDHCTVNIPISTSVPFYWLRLKTSAPVYQLGTFCHLGEPPGFYRGDEERAASWNEKLLSLVSYCRSTLAEVYGNDYVERVDRVVTINDRIGTLDDRVNSYANHGVHSPGALFKQLPALNSLCPGVGVKHVTITRLAKPPDHQLVEDLNLLANLNTVKAATGETEE